MKYSTYILFIFVFVFSLSAYPQKTNKDNTSWQNLIDSPNPNYYVIKEAFDKQWKDKNYQKGEGIQLFRRWEEFMLKHMDINGDYKNSLIHEHYKSIIDKSKNQKKSSGSKTWSIIGPTSPPGPDGYNNNAIGRVLDIGFSSVDTNLFYVAASSGGLWKTTDNGESYTYLSDEWISNIIKSLAVNPYNHNEIWCLVESTFYHSTNGGSSWTEIEFSGVGGPRLMNINFSTGTILIETHFGINYSLDNASSWMEATTTYNSVNDFSFHPTDNSIVYASSKNGLLISNDGGKSFSLTNPTGITMGNTRNRLAVTPAEPNSVFILTVSNSRISGVYKSSDKGVSFSKILSPSDFVYYEYDPDSVACGVCERTADNRFGGQGWIHACIGVSPIDPDIIYVGGVSIFYTKNGGDKWNYATSSFPARSTHVDHLNIRFQPSTNLAFSCNDGGIYKRSREKNKWGESQWEPKNKTLAITQIYSISTSLDGKRIITGQQDNGSYTYNEDRVDPWKFFIIGDGFGSAIDPLNNDVIYSTTQYSSIYKSSNGGDTYQRLASDDDLGGGAPFYTEFYSSQRKSGVLYTMNNNLQKSINGGETWVSITDEIDENLTFAKTIIQHGSDQVMILYGSQILYKTLDAGKTWESLKIPKLFGDASVLVSEVGIHSKNPNKLWLYDNQLGLHESNDGGKTWTTLGDEWKYLNVNKIVHVDGTEDRLLIATTYGVLEKPNGQNNYSFYGSGLPKVSCSDLEISYCTGEIFISTYGRGVWKTTLDLDEDACCLTVPKSINNSSLFCGSTKTLSVENLGKSNFVWEKDGVELDEKSSSINVNSGGDYSVYSTDNQCESVHYLSPLYDLGPSKKIDECTDFEKNLDDEIIILEGRGLLKKKEITGCSNNGDYAFGTSFTHSFHRTGDTLSFMIRQINLFKIIDPSLEFKISHRKSNSSNSGTHLRVLISSDCGVTYSELKNYTKHELHNENVPFGFSKTPSDCEQWNDYSLDLDSFIGKAVNIKFEIWGEPTATIQGYWGGNLFLDNICLNGVFDPNITEELDFDNFSIYPNPTISKLNIQSSVAISSVSVYDLFGKLIFTQTDENEIDLSRLSPGTYNVKVSSQNSTKVIKVVRK